MMAMAMAMTMVMMVCDAMSHDIHDCPPDDRDGGDGDDGDGDDGDGNDGMSNHEPQSLRTPTFPPRLQSTRPEEVLP